MERILFELCGKDPTIRFSPYAWRTRLSLTQKRLPFSSVVVRYTDKSAIAPSGATSVPVLRDGDIWIPDSWAIAQHLEKMYPEKPSLFGLGGETLCFFIQTWVNTSILPIMFRIICTDLHKMFDGNDAVYFYETRSQRIGMPLEDTLKHREVNMARLKEAYAPVRLTLKEQRFLSGPEPLYPDFALFGAFQCARLTSALDLKKDEPAITKWFEDVSSLYNHLISDLETPPLFAP